VPEVPDLGRYSLRLGPEDLEYLDSISDLTDRMRPFDEIAAQARGCPNPERYAGEEDWEV
jgi:hypothetical protein